MPDTLTDDEIITYALAHAIATLDWGSDDDARAMDLLINYGSKLGIDVPLGDEYQRAVLHHFDPDRIADFPLPDAEQHIRAFTQTQEGS